MQFGKVVGNIVSTRKTGKTEGLRLLIIHHLDENLQDTGKCYVCVDTINAKTGDIVLTCSSSSARMTASTKGVCVDNAVVGVVEIISSKKQDVYKR